MNLFSYATGIIVGLIIAALVGARAARLGRSAGGWLIDRWRSEYVDECPLCADGRGAPLTARRAHVFAERFDEQWAGVGAMSGVSVAYCRAHCPGGCSRGCTIRD